MGYDIEICVDCLVDAYGEGCDNESEHGCRDRNDWPNWDGFVLLTREGQAGYSWSDCDWCGQTLGGDRFPAYAFTRSEDGL